MVKRGWDDCPSGMRGRVGLTTQRARHQHEKRRGVVDMHQQKHLALRRIVHLEAVGPTGSPVDLFHALSSGTESETPTGKVRQFATFTTIVILIQTPAPNPRYRRRFISKPPLESNTTACVVGRLLDLLHKKLFGSHSPSYHGCASSIYCHGVNQN